MSSDPRLLFSELVVPDVLPDVLDVPPDRPLTTPPTPDTTLDTTLPAPLDVPDAIVVTGTTAPTELKVLLKPEPTVLRVLPTVEPTELSVDPVPEATPATNDVTGVSALESALVVPPEVTPDTRLVKPPELPSDVRLEASVVTGLNTPAVVPEVRLLAKVVTGASKFVELPPVRSPVVPAISVVIGDSNDVPLPAVLGNALGKSDNKIETGVVTVPIVLANVPAPVAPVIPVRVLPTVLPTPTIVVTTGVKSRPASDVDDAAPPVKPESTDVTGPSSAASDVPLPLLVPFALLNSPPMPLIVSPVSLTVPPRLLASVPVVPPAIAVPVLDKAVPTVVRTLVKTPPTPNASPVCCVVLDSDAVIGVIRLDAPVVTFSTPPLATTLLTDVATSAIRPPVVPAVLFTVAVIGARPARLPVPRLPTSAPASCTVIAVLFNDAGTTPSVVPTGSVEVPICPSPFATLLPTVATVVPTSLTTLPVAVSTPFVPSVPSRTPVPPTVLPRADTVLPTPVTVLPVVVITEANPLVASALVSMPLPGVTAPVPVAPVLPVVCVPLPVDAWPTDPLPPQAPSANMAEMAVASRVFWKMRCWYSTVLLRRG